MALPASGFGRPAQGGPGGSAGRSARAVVAGAAVATLLALAILAGSTWRGSGHVVTLDMPGAPAAAGGEGRAPTQAADRPAAAAGEDEGQGEGDSEVEPEAAAAVGDPAFFETPMQVIRRSNIRARPTPDSTALGRADEGAMVILVGPKPERGYFRVATGELEGWIWGANLAPADPSQQPDPAELPGLTAPDGAGDEPAAGR